MNEFWRTEKNILSPQLRRCWEGSADLLTFNVNSKADCGKEWTNNQIFTVADLKKLSVAVVYVSRNEAELCIFEDQAGSKDWDDVCPVGDEVGSIINKGFHLRLGKLHPPSLSSPPSACWAAPTWPWASAKIRTLLTSWRKCMKRPWRHWNRNWRQCPTVHVSREVMLSLYHVPVIS